MLNTIFTLLFCLMLASHGWAQSDDTSAADTPAETGSAESGTDAEEDDWDVNDPPGNWRSISIDTDSFTWTNLDVSPDGQTIVFDMLGDIYTVPIDGGKATAVTNTIAWEFQPAYSPDGSRIAYVSDAGGADNIWVMDTDGSNARAVTDNRDNLFHNPAWSPDGQWIAARKGYVSSRSIPAGSIWMVHVGGGSGLQLVDRLHGESSQKNIAEPAFSPDGRYLYYSQDVTSGQVWQYNKNALEQLFAVKRLDREKDETETIAGGPGGAIRPVPSPDGSKLAFVRRLPSMKSALVIQDLASGNETILFDELERDHQETAGSHGNFPAFDWTPDSNSLVFWTAGKLHRMGLEDEDPAVIEVEVSTDKQVRSTVLHDNPVWQDQVDVKAMRWAQYSPDGSKILFQALGHLYIQDADSDRPRRLTDQDDHFEFWPRFSADGKQIVYTTWDDQDLGTVRVISTRGGRSQIISNQKGHYVEPRFSADGSQVVFRKISGGYLLSPKWSAQPGLYVASLDGDQVRRVSKDGSAPQFSADGERVLFSARGEDGGWTLKSVNLEGNDPRTHAKGKNILSFELSPDQTWLAFTEQFNAYLTPFALSAQTVDLSRNASNVPIAQISRRSGEDLHWSADGQTLHWAHGRTLYSRDLKDAFAFVEGAPEELPDPVSEGRTLNLSVTADRPEGTIAITGGRVVTMRNHDDEQEVIENGTVVVEGNRITAVGPAGEVEVPEDAFQLDASGKTVLPGLFDAHAHGGMAMAELTPQQNWAQYSNLAFGVTTIHDPSNDSSQIFSHAEMQRAGQVIGPRTFSTGTILYGALAPGYQSIINNFEDAEFHVQRLADLGAISVKSYNQLARDARQWVIEAADQRGILVVPEGGMKFQHNLNQLVDGHTTIEHSLPVANIYGDVVDLWSQVETAYTPTFGVAYGGLTGEYYWYDRTDVWANPRLLRYTPASIVLPRAARRQTAPDHHYNHVLVAEHAEQLNNEGVPVLIGAHGQREGLASHWEMWMMEQGGFTPWEALRGATIDAAEIYGMDSEIGSIETGKLADLFIVDGNPLDDLRRSEFVTHTMLNGRLYEAASMNEIGNETREREPFYFELEDGDVFPTTALEQEAAATHRHDAGH